MSDAYVGVDCNAKPQGVLDIGSVIGKLNDLLDELKAAGKVTVDAALSHPALVDPVRVHFDVALSGGVV